MDDTDTSAPVVAAEPEQFLRLERLYEALATDIARANPVCQASGRCCRFTEYGHTLFLSELEARYLVGDRLGADGPIDEDGCPYQVGGLCTARERRPLGCRVYYCDPQFTQRQLQLSAEYTRRLKRLHDELGREWRYRPLHVFLREFADGAAPGRRG